MCVGMPPSEPFMADLHPQLALRLGSRPQPSFDNFVPSGNEEVLAALQALAPGEAIWLWGATGVGRSHLLLAATRGCGRYLAFSAGTRPGLLEGLEGEALVAIDDIDTALPDPGLEVALFRVVNELRARGGRLLMAALAPPRRVATHLPDLASRFSRAAVYEVRGLPDAALGALLERRATELGMRLPPAVVEWILRRFPRDPAALTAVVDTLDEAAARAGRAPSVALARSVFG